MANNFHQPWLKQDLNSNIDRYVALSINAQVYVLLLNLCFELAIFLFRMSDDSMVAPNAPHVNS